jgi:hypothetical protein
MLLSTLLLIIGISFGIIALITSQVEAQTNDPSAPVLFFSDLESGPKNGWEGSEIKGAAVSVWGKNFGLNRNSNFVTVNGARLSSDSDYAEWGEIGPARDLERITFWLNNNCQEGTGSITVTVNGTTSNALPFTVRDGNIYFIAKDGSDSNNGQYASNQGSGNGPWLSFTKANGLRNDAIVGGDIVYVRDGIYNDVVYNNDFCIDTLLCYLSVTFEQPLSVIGYPGEWPILGSTVPYGVYIGSSESNPSSNLHFHKLIWENSGHAIEAGGTNFRFIGNIFRDNQELSMGSVIELIITSDTEILGGLFKDSGHNADKDIIHLLNPYGSLGNREANNVEIGWNEFDHIIGDLDDPIGSSAIYLNNINVSYQVHDIYIHDNLMHSSPSATFYAQSGFSYNIYIWNNIIFDSSHFGKNRGNIDIMRGQDIFLWNNTFHNVGSEAQGISMINLWGNTSVESSNNIFHSVNGQNFISNDGSFRSINDLYYGNNAPSDSGITILNPITAEPRFNNMANHDFHLQSNSPAIDAGSSNVSLLVTWDYDSNVRPMDGDNDGSVKYDIGAYEFLGPYDPTEPDSEPPSVPQNLQAIPISSTEINLTWDGSTDNVGVNGYRIYRDGTSIAEVSNTIFIDRALSPGTTYQYTVLAFDQARNESQKSGTATATTFSYTPGFFYVDIQNPNCSDSLSREQVSYDSPWCTISASIPWLVPGDEVTVQPGVYAEHVTTPTGLEHARIKFTGGPGVILDGTGTSQGSRGFTLHNVAYVDIDFFEIRNYNHEGYDAITISGDSNHINLTNINIHDCYNGIIMEDDVHDIHISRSQISHTRYGLGGEDTAHDLFLFGITSHSNQDTSSSYGNGDGFSFDPGTYNIFIENAIAYDNLDAGFDIASSNFECDSCMSHNNTKYGFRLRHAGPATLINTLAYGNGWYPLQISAPEVYLYGSTYINGNDHGYAIESLGEPGIMIRDSIFADYANNVLSGSTSSLDEDYNLFYSASASPGFSIGPNSIQADPLFQDKDLDDFHLQPTSPAVDAGIALESFYFDLDGVPRPQGSGYDMGAYEAFSQSQTFVDVPPDYWAYDCIEALYREGYTAGCSNNPLAFCPEQAMTRDQGAVFLVRSHRGASFFPPQPTVQTFTDVPLSNWAVEWIDQLYLDGFTAGCQTDPLSFCPEEPYDKAAGSVFALRTKYGKDYVPPDPIGIFSDVPEDHWGIEWIEAAYNEGLLMDCHRAGPIHNFCPNKQLTRAMAAYSICQAKGMTQP